jgi:hypothetical protein
MSEPSQAAEDERVRQSAVDLLADLAAKGTIEDDFEVGQVLHGPEPGTMRLVIKARMTFPVPAAGPGE